MNCYCPDLSVLIRDTFGIPEGGSYVFYMMNTVRPSPYQYSDLVEEGVRGKINLPSRGKDFFHCTVSRMGHL